MNLGLGVGVSNEERDESGRHRRRYNIQEYVGNQGSTIR